MIQARNLNKTFGEVRAVNDVSFEVPEGHTLAIIGPSGCGKTTTLKMLNRLIEPTSGEVWFEGTNILEQNPIEVRRKIGYVLQRGGLFPHYTVERNVGLVPTMLKWPQDKISNRVGELLELVGLPPDDFLRRYPAELSGGEQQRVGIARALAADPPAILLDEPFSALDPITRHQMQQEFLRLKETVKKTMVFVTHDLKEAFLLANEILLMEGGQPQQCAPPEELREKPANEFVAQFVSAELSS